MKPLSTTYRQAGLTMTIIHREGEHAVACADPEDPQSYHEAFRIHHRKAATLPSGCRVEAGEYLPTTNQWGTAGWSFSRKSSSTRTARELAMAKLQERLALHNTPARTHRKGATW